MADSRAGTEAVPTTVPTVGGRDVPSEPEQNTDTPTVKTGAASSLYGSDPEKEAKKKRFANFQERREAFGPCEGTLFNHMMAEPRMIVPRAKSCASCMKLSTDADGTVAEWSRKTGQDHMSEMLEILAQDFHPGSSYID